MVHEEKLPEARGRGRSLVGSAFSADDGAPDQELRRVLTSDATPAAIIDALEKSRLLVAVMARLDSQEAGEEKDSHMAVVSMVNADGRRGLLAFTGLDALRMWEATARPVPATGAQIAQAALAEGNAALVIDVAGPSMVVITGEVLVELAARAPAQ